MTDPVTKIYKSDRNGGWEAKTEYDLGPDSDKTATLRTEGRRMLVITTHKSFRGLETKAEAILRTAKFDRHTFCYPPSPTDDYSKVLQSVNYRATEKAVTETHTRAIALHARRILAEVTAHYGFMPQENP